VYLVIFVLISQSSLSSLIPFEMPRRSCIFLSYYITVLVPLRYIRNAHALESLDIPPFHCIHPNIAAITTISQRITPSWAFRRVLFSYPFVTFCYPSDPIYTGQPPPFPLIILFDCPPTNLPPSLFVPSLSLSYLSSRGCGSLPQLGDGSSSFAPSLCASDNLLSHIMFSFLSDLRKVALHRSTVLPDSFLRWACLARAT